MRTKQRIAIALLAGTLSTPVAIQAQVTQYHSFSAYLNAISNPGTDAYTGMTLLPGIFAPTTLDRLAGEYSYVASLSSLPPHLWGFYGVSVSGNIGLSTDVATDAMVLSNFSGNVRGAGANFFGTGSSGNVLPTTIRVDWTEVGGATGFATLVNPGANDFFGVVSSSGGFTSVTMWATQPEGGGNVWPTIDNLTLGASPRTTLPPTTVPEPQTYALVAVGLLAIGLVRRRRLRLA